MHEAPSDDRVERTDPLEEGMERLSRAECERLLGTGDVGILALAGGEAPILRPVNFLLHETWLMIRTGVGQILDAADRAEPASFVLSQTDAAERTGWSVIVSGRLVEHRSMLGVPYLPLQPWIQTEKNNFVGLSIAEISGRRIVRTGTAE